MTSATTPGPAVRKERFLLLQPRWIVAALGVLVLACTCVLLGRWQLHRLDERKAKNHVITTNIAAPAVPLSTVLPGYRPATDADAWREVTVTGHYLPARSYVAQYRQIGDQNGFELLWILQAEDGSDVLVDRGFVPKADNSAAIPFVPAPPTQTVTVSGRLHRSEHGHTAALTPTQGAVRIINAPAIGADAHLRLVDAYVTVDRQTPAAPSQLQQLPLPDLSNGPHFFYALQWFLFSLLALSGLVWFTRTELEERRKRRAAGTAPDEPGPAVDGVDPVARPDGHEDVLAVSDAERPDSTVNGHALHGIRK